MGFTNFQRHDNGDLTFTITDSGAGGGWNWASPILYSGTATYVKGEVIYIPVGDALITTGYVDDYGVAGEDLGTRVYGVAGLWVATQAVPLVPIEGGYGHHYPRWPYPSSAGPDNAANFWWLLSFVCSTS